MTAISTPQEAEIEGDALGVYLAEYENIWSEVFARLDSQKQAFNYMITVMAALAAFFVTRDVRLDPELSLWLPLVISPFGFIFFDNELMIWSIIGYTRNHLQVRIAKLVDDPDVLLLEQNRYRYLGKSSRTCHHLLSYSRWVLFVAPVVLSIGYAVYFVREPWTFPYSILLAVDCLLGLTLLWGVWRAAREQGTWDASMPGRANKNPRKYGKSNRI